MTPSYRLDTLPVSMRRGSSLCREGYLRLDDILVDSMGFLVVGSHLEGLVLVS